MSSSLVLNLPKLFGELQCVEFSTVSVLIWVRIRICDQGQRRVYLVRPGPNKSVLYRVHFTTLGIRASRSTGISFRARCDVQIGYHNHGSYGHKPLSRVSSLGSR